MAASPTWRPYGAEIAYTAHLPDQSRQGLWATPARETPDRRSGRPTSPILGVTGRRTIPTTRRTGGEIVFSSTYPDDADDEIYRRIGARVAPRASHEQRGRPTADPVWSPDGKKIAFASNRDGNSEIYVMNADGTNQTRITNDPGRQDNPSWQPLPYPGYARPKGATPDARLARERPTASARRPTARTARRWRSGRATRRCRSPTSSRSARPTPTARLVNMTGYVQLRLDRGQSRAPRRTRPTSPCAWRSPTCASRARWTTTRARYEAQATVRLTDRTASAGDPATATDVLFPLLTQCTPTALTVHRLHLLAQHHARRADPRCDRRRPAHDPAARPGAGDRRRPGR